MALFQQSVIKKHIESLDSKIIEQKWQIYTSVFHNPVKQNNIRNSKEEQFQEGFLRELFVNVLGYTINPDVNFNLLTELKNTNNSRKADGAIIVDGKAIAVIELKGTETTDLNKIEIQAFGYKSNQAGCNYVITSNFEKLRFYIDNTTQQEEFNLFTLTKERFEFLYVCLAWESISNHVPTNLLNQSVSKENAITKQLYNDYSAFKRGLYNNLVELNPQHDKLELFKKTQKLLDRFLFIFFAEDRLLLPTNLIRRINKEWENLQKMRMVVSLYDRYVIYFHDLNEGAKVTLPAFGKKTGEAIEETHEIFAYNGGLFKPDEFLDTLKIDDQLLFSFTHKLSDYDFQSEVDVNILGHIFENSLNEIDEIKSEIEGNTIDKTKTRRKKDGVFYTPKYITKYIVDNTIGKLCAEKKDEIKLLDEDYTSTSSAYQKKTKKALLDKLADYRNWLLDLTICDPACGSGAFLNQALEFLIAEHSYVDELQAKLMGDAMILSDVENSILEKNIYGVDLNDESVEIAKLSLWLRTAQKGRKLNSLNDNIKCGNSLIDDVAVAGDKAFSWEKEFPDVFAKGGFDVIIGNPPYVLCQPSNTDEKLLEYYKTFNVASYKIDLFHLFFEKSINILNKTGFLGFITPNTYLNNKYIFPLRNFILTKTDIYILVNHEESVFVDANVDVATIILNRNKKTKNNINLFTTKNNYFHFTGQKSQEEYLKEPDNIFNLKADFIVNFKKCITLGEIFNSYFGIQAFDRKTSISNLKINDNYLPLIDGSDIIPGRFSSSTKYFNFINSNIKSGGDKSVYCKERILIRQIGQVPVVGLSKKDFLASNTLYSLYPKDDSFELLYVYAILNSNLMKAFWHSKYSDGKMLFPKIKGYQIKELPIKISDKKVQLEFVIAITKFINLNEFFDIQIFKFSDFFSKQYQIEKLTGKLEKWYSLEFVDFIKELNKAIKTIKGTPLTKKDEFEWIDLFEENKQKALSLKAEIDKTDKEIDQMVYALYELTEEEVKIVEGV
jgi:tRNA1(Val) A37 N6-methylase TrmN6